MKPRGEFVDGNPILILKSLIADCLRRYPISSHPIFLYIFSLFVLCSDVCCGNTFLLVMKASHRSTLSRSFYIIFCTLLLSGQKINDTGLTSGGCFLWHKISSSMPYGVHGEEKVLLVHSPSARINSLYAFPNGRLSAQLGCSFII